MANSPGEPASTSPVVESSRRIGIAEEDRVVEVENEASRGSPKRAEVPSRKQFALKDHRVKFSEAVELSQAVRP
jgi:hypothetical protein